MLFDFSGCNGDLDRFGEPTVGEMLAVCLGTSLFVTAAFVLEALFRGGF